MKAKAFNNKSKWLSTFVLMSFIALVALTSFLSETLKTSVKNHNEFIEQTLFFNNKEIENIDRLSLKNKSGEFIFEREITAETNAWKMVSPKLTSTSSLFIEKLFTSLKTIKTKKLLADDELNNTNYSLYNPTATLTLTEKNSKSIVLNIGIMNTIDNSTYVKIVGKKGIFHIEAPSISLENIKTNDLIESPLFDLTISGVTNFKLIKKNGPNPQLELSKTNNVWMSLDKKILDEKKVYDLLSDFTNIKSLHNLDDPQAQPYKQVAKNFTNSDYTIHISLSDGRNLKYQIVILTKDLPEFPPENGPYILVREMSIPVIHAIKKEYQSLFEIKNEILDSMTAPLSN